ncbi:immunoglobulin mu heavy chain-like isoform X2 [Seriola dumerili]|uniref:immunoglobulin mu heavy chain-like isoform X2 n=1 Tax=Seriola dumerili TaxID=41447 RepID=UPI000BBE56FE|nr:immunoglobulin mu heavy chain-like isoform X2 [Seriola dumerili]
MTVVQSVLLLALISAARGQSLTSSEPVVSRPGESVTLSCKVEGVSLAWLHWIRQKPVKGLEWIGRIDSGTGTIFAQSLQGQFIITKDSSQNLVYLKVKSLKQEDSAVYYCARTGDYGAFDYWGKGTMVTVSSATSTAPTVFPLMPCGSGTGDMVNLGCLATGFTPSSLTFTWDKNGAALTDFIQYPPVQKGNVYTGVSQIQVRKQDWNDKTNFKCTATHPAGTDGAILKPPTVLSQLPISLKVLASSNDEKEASFSCYAKDFSPKDYDIKWLKSGEEINNKIYEIKTPTTTNLKNGTKLYSAASFLTVPSQDLLPQTEFTCEFKGKKDNGYQFTNSSVIYNKRTSPECNAPDVEIKIEGPKVEDLFLHGKGTITCKVNEQGVDKIFWEDQYGNEMTGALQGPFNGKPLSLPLDISYDEWSNGVKRNCVVEHENFQEPLKKLYERNTGGETQRPSVFMLPPVEHTRTETVTLTCYVKDFFPHEVFVSWLVDDEAASDSKYKFSTTNPVKNNGSYSAYGQLSLGLDEWKNNNMVYSCVVYHQSVVNNIKAIVRSIGQRTSENTNLVNLNMNIPETCKAH